MDPHRKNLSETYNFLNTTRNELLTHALNIAMTGELKAIGEAFEMGDSYRFEIDQLKGTKDKHLNSLIELYESIEVVVNHWNGNGTNERDVGEF